MATKRNPEERSPTGPAVPGEAAAQPTGAETFQPASAPRAVSSRQGRATDAQAAGDGETATPEQVAHLQALASEYYGKLTETAESLNQEVRSLYGTASGYLRGHRSSTVLGAFALGVLFGLLSGRD